MKLIIIYCACALGGYWWGRYAEPTIRKWLDKKISKSEDEKW
jgi:hypothetical protein